MKVTSKGQVTVPLPIRSEFGLKPGTEVEFVTQDGNIILRAKRKSRNPIDDWLDEAIGVSRGKVTTASVMKLTRGES